MNPLTFQMQISNSLETQIKHYTEELNKLLSIANGKEIKIGVSDSLTQLVAELQKGMLNITKAQNESVEAGKKAEAQTKAQAEAIKAVAETNEKLAASQKKVQSAQPKQMEFDFTKQTTKLTEFAENVERCIGRIKTSIADLTANMGKGIDNTAFVQSLTAFTQAMQPFADLVEKLSASSGKYQEVMQQLAASSKDLLASVQQVKNVESSVNSKTTGDAQKDAAEGMRQYINNVNKLEHALMRLDNAIAQAESDKTRIAKNGGETKDIQTYIDNLNRLRDAILKVQQNPDILGQKGTMFRGTSEELSGLIKRFKDAAAASKGTKEDIANILGLAREIGNKSPLGVDFIRGLGGNQNFTQFANKLEAAVPKLNVANEKITESMARLDSVIGRSNGKGRVQELEQLKQKLQGFKDSLSGLSAIDAAAKLDNGFTKLIQDIQKATNAQENLLSSMDKLTFYQKNVEGMFGGKDFNDRLRNIMERYNTLTVEQGNRFLASSGMQGAGGLFESLDAFEKKVEEALKNPEILSQKGKVAELTMEFNKLSYAYHSCWSQAEKLASAQDRANKKSGGLTEDQIKLKEANDLYSAIVKKLTEYNKLIGKAGKLNIDTTELEKAIAELEKFRAVAKTIADGKGVGANGETARQLRFSQGYVDVSSKAEVSASSLRLQVASAKEAESAAHNLTAEEERLASAFQKATGAALGQSQVLSDLKSLMYQYFSIYGAQQFLSNLVNITGELELQKKSLEVILGSGTAASTMYSQIRDLSQQSPYTFEDLLKSHRQLAAFGIEGKDIYSTLKSLSDIGAGLDVDVSRLILAYGHTKSYGYLSGIQNRQFETAGIDLVGGLTDYYNKRAKEDRANGISSNFVTRKDIFKKMRDRSIPFEDVQSVILGLDQPGGKFYNMQERQYDTLGGKLRNLNNNYRIMMSEIGESNKGILTGFVDTINNLTEHWERYANVLKGVAFAYGILKARQMALGKIMLPQGIAIGKTISQLRRDIGMTNFLNNYGIGRYGAWRPAADGSDVRMTRTTIDSSNKINLAQRQMARDIINNKELSNAMKQRIALTSKLGEAEKMAILTSTGLREEQARYLVGLKGIRRGLLLTKLSFKSLAASMAAMLPQLAIFTVIAAITSLHEKSEQMKEDAKDFAKTIHDNAKTDAEGLQQALDPYGSMAQLATSSKASDKALFAAQAQAQGVQDIFNDLRTKLENQSPMYDGDYFDIMKANTQLDQLKAMFQKFKTLQHVKDVEQKTSGLMEDAMNEGSGWFARGSLYSENLKKNMEEYAGERKDYIKTFESGLLGSNYTNDFWEKLSSEEVKNVRAYATRIGEAMRDAASKRRVAALYLMRQGADSKGRFSEKIAPNKIDSRNYEDVTEGMKFVADKLSSTFINYYGHDVDGMSEHFSDVMNQMLSQSSIGDQATIDQLTDTFFTQLIQSMQAQGMKRSDIQNFIKQSIFKMMGADVSKEIGGKINDNTPQSEVNRQVRAAVDKVQRGFIQARPKMIAIAKQYGLPYNTILQIVNDAAHNIARAMATTEPWQRRALKFKLGIDWDQGEDWSSYIDKVRKELHDKASKMFNNVMRFKTKFHLDIAFDAESKDLQQRIKHIVNDVLNPKIAELYKKGPGKNPGIWAQIKETKETRDTFLEMYKMAKYLNEEGVGTQSQKDINKENSKAEKAKRAAEEAKRKAETAARKADSDAEKRLSARLKLIQDAYNMFKNYYDTYHDKKFALDIVRQNYKGLRPGDFKNLTSDAGLVSLFSEFIKEVRGTKWNNPSEMRDRADSLISTATSAKQNAVLNDAKNRIKEFTDAVKKATDTLSDNYTIFKEARDKTGDTPFAMGLSGFTYGETPAGSRPNGYNGWSDRVKSITDLMFAKLAQIGASMFNTADLSSLYGLSGDNLKNAIAGKLGANAGVLTPRGKNETKAEYEKRSEAYEAKRQNLMNNADAIVSIVEAWINAVKEMTKTSKEAAIELEASPNSYGRKRQLIRDKYAKAEENLYAMNEQGQYVLDAPTRARLLRRARLQMGIEEADINPTYQHMLSSPTTMKRKDAVKAARNFIETYTQAFNEGVIDASTYDSKTKGALSAIMKANSSGVDLLSNMASFGGLFFNSSNQQNQNDLQQYRTSVLEDMDEAKANGDTERLTVLERLLQALEHVIEGVGGTSEIRGVVKYGRINGNWDSMSDKAKGHAVIQASADHKNHEDDNKEGWFKKGEDALRDPMDKFIKGLTKASAATNLFSNTLDSLGLGDTGLGQAASDAGGIMSSTLSGASSLSALGPYGMAAGAALGLIGGIAQTHDKHLQKKIEQMQQDVSKIENYTQTISKAQERTLGYDYGDLIRSYQLQYAIGNTNVSGSALGAMRQYYYAAGGGNITGYEQQYNLLIQKRKDYSDMYNAENSKKKKSSSALEEYKSKIADLDDQIRYFSQDIANNLYGIDLKSWADQLSDALMTAFENGDNAAEAFKNNVTSILQGLTKQMISLGVMQPLFERLQKQLFGYTDKNGVVHKGSFDASHPDSNKEKWTADISEALGKGGYIQEGAEASKVLFDKIESIVEQSGNTLFNSNSSSTSSSIKGITEQTADLLASYLNAIRADVSVIRQLQSGKTIEYMDGMTLMAKSQVQYQSQIAANTLRNAEAAEKIVTSNDEILYLFRAVTNDTKTVSTRVR